MQRGQRGVGRCDGGRSGGHSDVGLAGWRAARRAGCAPRRQRLGGVLRPALLLLLQLQVLAHGVVQAGTHSGKAGALVGIEQVRAERLPIPVQRHQVVDRDLRLRQQHGRRVDQRCRPHPRLAQRHGRVQPLFGDAVHTAVMLAKRTLSLAQRVLTGQRLHRRQFDLQQRRGNGRLQQRGVVAQRRLQARLPQRQCSVALAGLAGGFGLRSLGRVGRLLGGLLGRLLRQIGRFAGGGCRHRQPFWRRSGAPFLEKPAQHGIAVGAAGRVDQSGECTADRTAGRSASRRSSRTLHSGAGRSVGRSAATGRAGAVRNWPHRAALA